MEDCLYCRRCDDRVDPVLPWAGWRPAWRAWIVGLLAFMGLMPFMIGDFCVTQPSFMLYLVGGSILRRESRQPPLCGTCSLPLDATEHGGTKIRRRT